METMQPPAIFLYYVVDQNNSHFPGPDTGEYCARHQGALKYLIQDLSDGDGHALTSDKATLRGTNAVQT